MITFGMERYKKKISLYSTILGLQVYSYCVNMSIARIKLGELDEKTYGIFSGFFLAIFLRIYVAMYAYMVKLSECAPVFITYRHGKRLYTLPGNVSNICKAYDLQKQKTRGKTSRLKIKQEPIIMVAFLGTLNVLQRLEEYLGPHGGRHDLSHTTVGHIFPEAKPGQKLTVSMFSRNGIEQQSFEINDKIAFDSENNKKVN